MIIKNGLPAAAAAVLRVSVLVATIVLTLQVTTTVAQSTSIPFYDDGDPSFFFIGNSYTSSNNLPNMVASLLREGVPEWTDSLSIDSRSPGGKTLGGHLADLEAGDSEFQGALAPAATNTNNWKWIVLQDQSQIAGFAEWDWEGTEFYDTFRGAQALDGLAEGTGAQTMFFMTWGRRLGDSRNIGLFPDFLTMQGRLTEGYMRYQAATTTAERPTFVAPVGLVFQTIYMDHVDAGVMPTDDGTLFSNLYSGDGSHPSAAGTYTAALTLYSSMTGLDPTNINWFPDGLDESAGRSIQDAVGRTILETFAANEIPYPWTTDWGGASATPAVELPETTASPTDEPTLSPTTVAPTDDPTMAPTKAPTPLPTLDPTLEPTLEPTDDPTADPTEDPTADPTASTNNPTVQDVTNAPTTMAPTTSTPSTNNPTVQPGVTTSSPTVVATSVAPSSMDTAPGTSTTTTKGSIAVSILYDQYPEDIAWTFLPKGADSALFFQPYNSTTLLANSTQSMTFDNLEQNQTYGFKIYDKVGDGLFGHHGQGYVKIMDQNNFGRSTVLFTMAAPFGAYYEVDLDIGSFGQATVANKGSDYVPSSWPDLEELLMAPQHSDETEWPGTFPTDNPSFSLVVNVDLDENPQEVSWELFQSNQSSSSSTDEFDWRLIDNWNGTFAAPSGSLNSTEFSDLDSGWYRFIVHIVHDSAGNGLSTDTTPRSNQSGYVTLTGPLTSTKEFGLIWGSNNPFQDSDEIYFLVDESGYISHIRFVTDKDARVAPPSIAPSAAPSLSLSPTVGSSSGSAAEVEKGPMESPAPTSIKPVAPAPAQTTDSSTTSAASLNSVLPAGCYLAFFYFTLFCISLLFS